MLVAGGGGGGGSSDDVRTKRLGTINSSPGVYLLGWERATIELIGRAVPIDPYDPPIDKARTRRPQPVVGFAAMGQMGKSERGAAEEETARPDATSAAVGGSLLHLPQFLLRSDCEATDWKRRGLLAF
uniref:Uncharacterized protein n=1 Tax=Plectus sambesii TaxID=2011161 RepID=A0A914VTA0_9BILA